MAITAPIPLPGYGAEAFMAGAAHAQGIFNAIQQAHQANESFPERLALLKAQAAEATGKAAKANAWAALAAHYGHLGGQTNPPTSPTSTSDTTPAAPSDTGAPTASSPTDQSTGNFLAPETDEDHDKKAPNPLPNGASPMAATTETTEYPNEVVAQMIGLQPLSQKDKAALDVKTSAAKKGNETNIVSAQKSLDSIKESIKAATNYVALDDVMNRKPKLTGPGTALAIHLKALNDPDAADFNNYGADAWASLGRAMSQRGGAQVLQLAKIGKPDISQQPEYNVGMIKAGYEKAKSNYELEKKAYESSTGKKLPNGYEFPSLKSFEAAAEKAKKVHKWEIVNGKLKRVT